MNPRYAAMAQLVEHILGKDEVPGPNPGSSSRQPRCSNECRGFGFVRVPLHNSYPARTGERYDSYGGLNLEESTGLFTVRIRVAARDNPDAQTSVGALVLYDGLKNCNREFVP